MRVLVLLLALVASTSCVIRTGHKAIEDRRVLSPFGIETKVVDEAGSALVTGELLSADSTQYVLWAASRVVVVPGAPDLNAMLTSSRQAGLLRLGVRTLWPRPNYFELKSHSRFSYGIPPSAMAALLANAGQTVPDTIRLVRP